MRCEFCAFTGQESTVWIGPGSITLMYFAPYYDEKGNYHHHDANTITQKYTCSNGHQWETKNNKGYCPTCGVAWT